MKKSLINRLILLRTFFTYKVKEDTLLKVHLNIFGDLLMKMKVVDMMTEEKQKVMILLSSMPDR